MVHNTRFHFGLTPNKLWHRMDWRVRLKEVQHNSLRKSEKGMFITSTGNLHLIVKGNNTRNSKKIYII